MNPPDDMPRIPARTRLEKCDACSEFVFEEDRVCPACGVDRAMMTLANAGSPELLEAIIEHYEKQLDDG